MAEPEKGLSPAWITLSSVDASLLPAVRQRRRPAPLPCPLVELLEAGTPF